MYPNITFVPVDELTTPKSGMTCMTDRYWVVHPEHGALIYKRYSPQCNIDRRLPERLVAGRYPGCHVELIPVAFIEQDHRE